jgi:hypothetical protein
LPCRIPSGRSIIPTLTTCSRITDRPRPDAIVIGQSISTSLSSWGIREARMCHSIASPSHASWVASSVASLASSSQVRAFSRYFSDTFKRCSPTELDLPDSPDLISFPRGRRSFGTISCRLRNLMRNNCDGELSACPSNQNDLPRSLRRISSLPDRDKPLHYRRIGVGCCVHVIAGVSPSTFSII